MCLACKSPKHMLTRPPISIEGDIARLLVRCSALPLEVAS